MSIDPTRTRLGNYQVTWQKAGAGSAYDFGAVDKITPKLDMVRKPIKVGTIGDVKIGERIIGLEGTVIVEARELDEEFFQAMCPWYSSGSIALIPSTVHQDLYDYAGPLILHPIEEDESTDLDLTIVKACPIRSFMSRDGNTDDSVSIEFVVFPDRDEFPTLVYGYVGAVPE